MRFFDAGVQGKRLKKRIRPFVLDSAPNGDTPPLVQTMHHWCDETGAVRFFEKVAPVRYGARRDCTSGAGKILKFFFFYGVGASQGHYYLIPCVVIFNLIWIILTHPPRRAMLEGEVGVLGPPSHYLPEGAWTGA